MANINLTDCLSTPVDLEYFNGERWIPVGDYPSEKIAWMTLDGDNDNYRTIDRRTGTVIRDTQV